MMVHFLLSRNASEWRLTTKYGVEGDRLPANVCNHLNFFLLPDVIRALFESHIEELMATEVFEVQSLSSERNR